MLNSSLLGGTVQCMFFLGSLVPTFTLDKMGRRRPMMWGSFGLAISMMLIAVLLSFHGRGYPTHIAKPASSASVAFFYTYMLVRWSNSARHMSSARQVALSSTLTVDFRMALRHVSPVYPQSVCNMLILDFQIFGATANCIPWVYVPEILPLHARSKGTAIGISSNWLWNFVIVSQNSRWAHASGMLILRFRRS